MSENKKVFIQEFAEYPDVVIWKFATTVDQTAIGEIEQNLEDYISKGKVNMVADLSETEKFDVAVIGILMGARSRLHGLGGDFILSGVSAELEKDLHAMGLHRIFEFYPNIYDAARKFMDKMRVETVSINFPTSLDYVPSVRDFICNMASMRGFSEKESYRIQTIVDEICNNAIEHGSRKTDEPITVVCTIDDEKMDLTVEDRGADKSAAEGLKKAIAKVQFDTDGKVSVEKRGRGLPIVAMLADMLEIDTRSGPGTKVHVIKFKNKKRDEYFTL